MDTEAVRSSGGLAGSVSGERSRVWWALIPLLLLFVYGPLVGAGPVGEDYQVLVESSRAVNSELGGAVDGGVDLMYSRAGTDARPLAALSLGTTGWLWTQAGVWTSLALTCLRLENLALLVLGAYLLGHFVRRLVVPWTGREQAVAAGRAAMLLLCVHPLSVSAVAAPSARGDLLGGLLAVAAGAAFLRGRQERSYGFVGLAALLTLLSTLASELGFLVPLWLSLIEYFSSRRYRPGPVRTRTALTTFFVFGAVASSDIILRLVAGVPAWPENLAVSLGMWLDLGTLWTAALFVLQKLGLLMVPVNGAGAGGIGYVVAVLVLVAVIQPALHAGRSAPRFWATVLSAWLVVILMTASIRASVSVGPGDLSAAAGLFPAVMVMAIGLGLAGTAVTGRRRYGIPLVVALMLSALARSNAEGLRAAADEGLGFQQQVGEIITEGGADQHYLVLDPPELTRGYGVLPRELDWIFDRAMGFQPGSEALWVRPITEPALVAFSREPEFDALRRDGLVLITRHHGPSQGGTQGAETSSSRALDRWRGQALELTGLAPRVMSWRNAEPAQDDPEDVEGSGHWTGELGDRPSFLDSAAVEQITVDVGPLEVTPLESEIASEGIASEGIASEEIASEEIAEERDAAEPTSEEHQAPQAFAPEPPSIYWRSRGGLVRAGEMEGVWVLREGRHLAVFDPGGSLEWLLGPRVDSLLMLGILRDAREAELRPTEPAVEGVAGFEIRNEDWWFVPREDDAALLGGAESEWVVTLLDLADLRYLEVQCEFDGDVLVAEEVEVVVRHFWSGRARLAWALERRVNGVVISRTSGRL